MVGFQTLIFNQFLTNQILTTLSMKKIFTLIFLLSSILGVSAQTGPTAAATAKTDTAKNVKADTAKKVPEPDPLSYADFSWVNGQNRQSSKLLDNAFFTGDFTFDMN